jgi:hypothetical protein
MSDVTDSSGDDRDDQSGRDEPEPEGGPRARQREFLEERLGALRPKAAGPAQPAGPQSELAASQVEFEPPPPPAEAGAPAAPPGEVPPPPLRSPRAAAMDEFRRRQREARRDGAPAPAGEAHGADTPSGEEAPPEPPAPPPAENWVPIGPSVLRRGQAATQPGTSGRTVGLAIAPGGTRVYAATANGGIWRSDDTGRTWRSMMESFDLNPVTAGSDSLACGAVALSPGATAATDVVYVGTGEGAGGAYFGVGPVVSTDGGASWTIEPVSPGSTEIAGSACYELAIDPGDPARVVVATRVGAYRREPDGAGGFHWDAKTLAGSSWITSVVAARAGGVTTFYAASWFGPVYSSTDGDTWSPVGTGFPTTNVGRVSLAVQPDDPSVVYALVSQGSPDSILGVWRLDTSDNTWRQVSGHPPFLFGNPNPSVPPGTQGSYDIAIAVDPNNVNRIYLGGSTVQSGGAWSGSIERCVVSSSGSGASLSYSMTPTYIGASTHADVHTLEFTPGDSNKLWVGCDGGVFYSTNPTGTGNIFEARNTGLATLTMNYLAQHPSEDAVLFSGTQDNGGARFTGEEAWLHSVWGDSGHFVVNWNDPYTAIATYVRASVNRTSDGGTRYNYTPVNVPIAVSSTNVDAVLFYAPLVGTPPTSTPSDAQRVAFGSNRPWISDGFGGGWQSIPDNSTTDRLGAGGGFRIRSMAFSSRTRLYVGTMNGEVHRYDQSGATWTRTQLDTIGGANALPLAGPVTRIVPDPADANSIYLAFGGSGDYRHVWHFDGSGWEQRSGPAAGAASRLLDIHHNALVVDPDNPTHLYAGADIGVWRSTDSGANWAYYSDGLPDSAVMDLLLHRGRRLLRASTHGRSVYERRIDSASAGGVELYVRDTQLDLGRFTTVNGLPDPTDQGETVRHWRGPDIKVDTPDTTGTYQFPLTADIDFFEFVDVVDDDSRSVATHATADIVSRVYVQVHNRGVVAADDVRVMLLLANASAGLPALPAGYWTDVQNGTPINTADWKTVGIVDLDDVRVGAPKVAAFSLSSSDLPPPAMLAGNDHHCVLALVHHVSDPYGSTNQSTDPNSMEERKAAHKNLKVVQFTGTVPAPPPVVMPVRIHNPDIERTRATLVRIRANGYRGRIRLFVPEMRFQREIERSLSGFRLDQDFAAFDEWAEQQHEMVRQNLAGPTPFDRRWSKQRLEDIELVSRDHMLDAVDTNGDLVLGPIEIEPRGRHTLFVVFDRPANGRVGERFDVEIAQLDEERQVIGALDTRIELQPEPEVTRPTLEISATKWWRGGYLVRAKVVLADGRQVTESDGASVDYSVSTPFGIENREGSMRWHRSWRCFYALVRVGVLPLTDNITFAATASVGGRPVATAKVRIDVRPWR